MNTRAHACSYRWVETSLMGFAGAIYILVPRARALSKNILFCHGLADSNI